MHTFRPIHFLYSWGSGLGTKVSRRELVRCKKICRYWKDCVSITWTYAVTSLLLVIRGWHSWWPSIRALPFLPQDMLSPVYWGRWSLRGTETALWTLTLRSQEPQVLFFPSIMGKFPFGGVSRSLREIGVSPSAFLWYGLFSLSYSGARGLLIGPVVI